MPLANLVQLPSDADDRQVFDYHHWQDHLALVQAANKQLGTQLNTYPIWPAPDHGLWLKLHQQFHDDLAPLLKVPNSDLQQLDHEDDDDRKDWAWRNYQFHQAAHAVLKLI